MEAVTQYNKNNGQQVVVQKAEAQVITKEMVEQYIFSSKQNFSKEDKEMFMQLCLINKLNPFKREIYPVLFGGRSTFVVAYNVFIQRAEATGFLDGWNVKVLRDGSKILGAVITIYRKDFAHPFEWEVSFNEFNKGMNNWKQMPEFMIKKVCIGQGFRLAFPNELTGLYLQEELEDKESNNNIPSPEYKIPQQNIVDAEVVEETTPKMISDAQKKMLFAVANKCMTKEHLVKGILKISNNRTEHANELTLEEASKLIEQVDTVAKAKIKEDAVVEKIKKALDTIEDGITFSEKSEKIELSIGGLKNELNQKEASDYLQVTKERLSIL